MNNRLRSNSVSFGLAPLAVPALITAVGLCRVVVAQTSLPASATPAQPPLAAAAPGAVEPNAEARTLPFNFLIIALDEINEASLQASVESPPAVVPPLPSARMPGPASVAPPAPSAPSPASRSQAGPIAPPPSAQPAPPRTQPRTQPGNPVPPAITPAITPAGARFPIVIYASAKKSREDKDAELFRVEPDTGGSRPLMKKATPAPTAPGVPAAAVPTAPLSPVAPAAPGGLAERTPGRAQSAAASLRRVLLRVGFQDVLNTTPEGAAVTRAVNSRRLTQRVIDNLRTSTTRLIAASQGAATPAASGGSTSAPRADVARHLALTTQSAARIGQALGYRGVVVLAVIPRTSPAAPMVAVPVLPELVEPVTAPAGQPAGNKDGNKTEGGQPDSNKTTPDAPLAPQPTITATYALVIVDALAETAEPLVFDESGVDDLGVHQAAAATSAAVVAQIAKRWPPRGETDRAQLATKHLTAARALITQGDAAAAQDALNQVLALDPTRTEAHTLLGDLLQATDPAGAAVEYRYLVDIKPQDGEAWAKLAIAYALSSPPDLPRSLEAGRKALALRYDSAGLRQALATVQWGRAEIFRKHERVESAEEAERDAKAHLNRAIELAPADDPTVLRLISRQLVEQGRYREAVEALDRISRQYPNDIPIQKQYAEALVELGGRSEDAFVAWSRVWKMTGETLVPLDYPFYFQLADGFDRRLAGIGKTAALLTTGVANRAVSKESAVLQLTRLAEDVETAESAIKIIQPPDQVGSLAHSSRVYAADLMRQAVGAHQLYLETDQDIYRVRAIELSRQSILSLNAIRTAPR